MYEEGVPDVYCSLLNILTLRPVKSLRVTEFMKDDINLKSLVLYYRWSGLFTLTGLYRML